MPADTWLQILFAICGIFIAGVLAYDLVTGRVRLATRTIARASDARTYWKAVGINVLLALTLALAIWLPERIRVPSLFIGLMTSQLLLAYVAGEVPRGRGRVWSRARGDRGFRNFVILYSVMLAFFIFALVAMLASGRLTFTTL